MTPKNRTETSPRSGAVLIHNEDPDLHHGWTGKRLRPQTGRGIEVREGRDDNPIQVPLVSSKTGTARKRKAAAKDYELQSGPDQPLALVEPDLNAGVVSCEADPAPLFRVVPTVARQIEESAAREQLSCIRNRLALAEFYRAYFAAQAHPDQFLQIVNQVLPTLTACSAALSRMKRAEVKTRFIDLVFNQSGGNRNRKKDSTRVHDWQTLGRPWFNMISRFGNGVLLLIPAELTNDRQASLQSLVPSGIAYLADIYEQAQAVGLGRIFQTIESP
ncbi:MAG: hypothetical protein Q9191_000785 [Dirinaria sp. TL-2023a]